MLKKVLSGIFAAVLLLSIGTTSAFAVGPGQGPYFVDADGDGVCDYAGTACAYVDADGDGICDNCGRLAGAGCGGNFVDEDGDGICDYAGTACPYRNANADNTEMRPRGGAGWGNGCRRGHCGRSW